MQCVHCPITQLSPPHRNTQPRKAIKRQKREQKKIKSKDFQNQPKDRISTGLHVGVNFDGFCILYPISYFEGKERFNLLEDMSATGAFQRRQFICILLQVQVQNSCILRSPPGSMINVSRIKSLDHYHHFRGSGK